MAITTIEMWLEDGIVNDKPFPSFLYPLDIVNFSFVAEGIHIQHETSP